MEDRELKGTLPSAATELGRLSDRLSFLYVERAVVDRDAGAVTFWREDGVASVPAAMLAVLLLGPGTKVTHAAVSLLAASGCKDGSAVLVAPSREREQGWEVVTAGTGRWTPADFDGLTLMRRPPKP